MLWFASPVAPVCPVLLGCSGPELTKEEQAFFAEINPFGFILFARNCIDPVQLSALTTALRESVKRDDLPIFVDQEGGRVARLKPPYWPTLPAMGVLGDLFGRDPVLGREALVLHTKITAYHLRAVGIDGNCAPVLDLRIEGADAVIGDRSFGRDPNLVAACGRIVVDTYLACGVLPVIKHMPGHGRVTVDPHQGLPRIEAPYKTLATEDFVPFLSLRDAPIAMNCHAVFRHIDGNNPVSLSALAHRDVLRGALRFKGLIFSDDMAMGALTDPLPQRAMRAIEAGTDVLLYCSGVLEEMRSFVRGLPALTPRAEKRWIRAWEKARRIDIIQADDVNVYERRLAELVKG